MFLAQDGAIGQCLRAVLCNRHLIVVGYSGCDDFDVMPSLLAERPVRGITWIHHSPGNAGDWRTPSEDLPDIPPCRLLRAHGKSGTVRVVRGNTAELLRLPNASSIGHSDWEGSLAQWAITYLSSKEVRDLLLARILSQMERHSDSIDLLEAIDCRRLPNRQQAVLQCCLAAQYVHHKDPDKAILALSEMTDDDRVVAGFSIRGYALLSLARINGLREQFKLSKMYLASAADVFKGIGDVIRYGDCLHEMGRIELAQGNSKLAAELLELANTPAYSSGDTYGVAIGFVELSRALLASGDPKRAKQWAFRAVEMLRLNGNTHGLAIAHHALGVALAHQGNLRAPPTNSGEPSNSNGESERNWI